jgi:thermitase
MIRRRLSGFAVAVALALLPASADAADHERIIIVHEPGSNAVERSAVRREARVRLVQPLALLQAEVAHVPAGRLREALRELNRHADVHFAEPDRRVRAMSDPLFAELYGLQRIAAPAAWSLSTGAGVTVAVVDTGIAFDHPDLTNRIAANPSEQLNGIDDDRNGFRDDVRGWDFVNGDNASADDNGHGSHVSGTIAAERGNGVGIAGVAPGATVLPLKALDEAGEGYLSDVASAFDYAGRMGVPIVNASLGAHGEGSPTLEMVFERHPHTLYIAAAGNEGRDIDVSPTWPCSARALNVLCVGASDEADRRAPFSSFGRRSVDLFAPGVDIVSTVDSTYAAASGTSFAAPHIAGVAALVLSRNGGSALAVKNAILAGADAVAALGGLAVTGGRANAHRALTVTAPDGDADGVGDAWDGCPGTVDADQADRDDDGVGNVCDDSDGDGVTDARDGCPDSSAPRSLDGCLGTIDSDADGLVDVVDNCPAAGAPGTADGCPLSRGGCPNEAAASGCLGATIVGLSARPVDARRRVVVRLRLTRPATVYVTAAARRRCRTGRCRFKTVASKRVDVRDTFATAKLAHRDYRRFPRGRYRVRAKIEVTEGDSSEASRRLAIR